MAFLIEQLSLKAMKFLRLFRAFMRLTRLSLTSRKPLVLLFVHKTFQRKNSLPLYMIELPALFLDGLIDIIVLRLYGI